MAQKRQGWLLAAARKGGAASAKKSRKEALERYYADPARCRYCGEVIRVKDGVTPSSVKKRKFCNHSCAAKYNNLGRGNGVKRSTPCLYCGKKTTNRKYCSALCASTFRLEARWAKMDKQDNLPGIRATKRYLINRRGHKCEICGLSEWRQQPVALILDHIDGNSNDNHRSNLRLVCPNCDAQLPTYKGKNKGNGRYSRRQRYRDGKSY